MSTVQLIGIYALILLIWAFYKMTTPHQRERWLWKGITGLLIFGAAGFIARLLAP